MFSNRIVLPLVVALATCATVASGSGRLIPPLFKFDNYEKCRQQNFPGVFCYAKVIFETETDPIKSNRIVSNFRHNVLDWGICVPECERELATLSEKDRQRLYQPKFAINYTYAFPSESWPADAERLSHRYSRLLNVCINKRLERNYNVAPNAYSEIEYCTSNELPGVEKGSDWLKITFGIIVLTLIGALLGANAIDWLGKDHWKEHIIVTSFSVQRNWRQLRKQPDSQVYRDFGYIDGLRVLISTYVLIVHCLVVCALIPLENPEVVEMLLLNPLVLNFASAAPFSVQTFFVISSLLLSVSFFKDIQRKPQLENGYFRSKIINRLIRITPVYYFFLLFSVLGTAGVPGLELGRYGYKSLVLEQEFCRRNWWRNVLFVNNLPLNEERCFLHGWYLGADLQLFTIALLLLAILWKYPGISKPLLSIVTALSMILSASLVHFMQLESSIPIRLSDVQLLLVNTKWFTNIYTPGYTNANACIAGIIIGYLYHQTRHGNLNLDHSKFYNLVKKLSIPVMIFGLLPVYSFYQYEISRPSWWTTLHFVIYNNCSILLASVCFIENFRKPPGVIRRVLSSQLMTSLGKLSFSVYIVHVPVLRVLLNYLDEMPEVSLQSMTLLFLVLVIVSYLVGVVVYFCIEQPCSLILNEWSSRQRKDKVE
ncbi:O-acyltransferase like protein-like [Toxorhynchites rutilus septentrionalis]|uniref:O-acyltransferase like protein-like n=1 Tax=Toxorhynchites rutilus septentrionalis TaxID=329112 RepID=UPI00247836B6|nr:O-acyltransferase like protein-like [Toxorhynchites rutilus septentrionalis]